MTLLHSDSRTLGLQRNEWEFGMPTFDLVNSQMLPGDVLRDEAANLLATRFGDIQIEHRVEGKKADIFFSQRHFGKTVRIYVEAKDSSRRLTRSQVKSIWMDYFGILTVNKPSTLLIITRHGLTSDAQRYVQDELDSVRHQTIWELEDELLGIIDYIRTLSTLYDEGGLASYYIAAKARPVRYESRASRHTTGEPIDLYVAIQKWLADDGARPLAILGGYGAGKSSLARRVIASQAQVALSSPYPRRPILIRLGSLARYSSLEGILGGMFTFDYPVEDFNVHRFLRLNDLGRLLVVLDGFDEMKHAMSWADFRAQIAALNRLVVPRSKVILLGRPSAFMSAEEHFHVLRGLRSHAGGWLRLQDWPEFDEFDLEPFTDGERSAFVQQYLTHRYDCDLRASGEVEEAWVDARAREVNVLAEQDAEIFRKPVHAKILTDLAADPTVDLTEMIGGISKWGLYRTFFRSLAERESGRDARRPIPEESRLDFLREVALWLWTQQSGSIAFSDGDIADEILAPLPDGDAVDIEAKRREYLAGAFLEKKQDDVYYFGHRSFVEFLIAERMVRVAPRAADHTTYSQLFRDGVAEFLRECPDQSAVRSWIETLPDARGPLHELYFDYLGEVSLGMRNLLHQLPANCVWRRYIEATRDNRRYDAMLSSDDVLCALMISDLERSGNFSEPAETLDSVAPIILERLFKHVKTERGATKYTVDLKHDGAKRLAAALIDEVCEINGRLVVGMRPQRLIERARGILQSANVDVIRDGDLTAKVEGRRAAIPTSTVPLADLVANLSEPIRARVREYFRSNANLTNLTTSGRHNARK